MPVANSLESLKQLPSVHFIAEKAASIAPIVSYGMQEDVLLRAICNFGKVAGTLNEGGHPYEAGTIARSALIMLDESLPGSSRAFNEKLVSNLAESLTKYVRLNLDELIPTSFVEGLSNTALKKCLRNQSRLSETHVS